MYPYATSKLFRQQSPSSLLTFALIHIHSLSPFISSSAVTQVHPTEFQRLAQNISTIADMIYNCTTGKLSSKPPQRPPKFSWWSKDSAFGPPRQPPVPTHPPPPPPPPEAHEAFSPAPISDESLSGDRPRIPGMPTPFSSPLHATHETETSASPAREDEDTVLDDAPRIPGMRE